MREGLCHICGSYGPLTFEHVPPKSAFNNRPIIKTPFEKLFAADDLDDWHKHKGPTQQKGAGAYTLCGSCNNNTGAWYGKNYVDWAYQGLYSIDFAKSARSLAKIYWMFPLRVIKQIVCMFFSANSPQFQSVHTELVRFVLNREMKYLPRNIRIYAALCDSDRTRQSAITAMLNLEEGAHKLFSEISYPPFTYIMSVDSPPPDSRLVDISFLSHYGYVEWKDLAIKLPILPVYNIFPGDYRTRDRVLADSAENRARAAKNAAKNT